jgi:hypothetical protein
MNKAMPKMTDSGEWLVPFKGRNASGAFNQNFLWRTGNLYVMDNHRAALWCWLQHVDPKQHHSLFHIDRHYDALTSRLDTWLANLPADWSLGVDEYLARTVKHQDIIEPLPLFCWGNYVSIYLAVFGDNIKECRFATHRDGDEPNHSSLIQCDPWEIPDNLDFWLGERCKPWIMNIDLDYLFWQSSDEDDLPQQMFSTAYIEKCLAVVRKKIADGTIAVTTIALSPEYCGGWEQSEEMLDIVLSTLGISFRLPQQASSNEI